MSPCVSGNHTTSVASQRRFKRQRCSLSLESWVDAVKPSNPLVFRDAIRGPASGMCTHVSLRNRPPPMPLGRFASRRHRWGAGMGGTSSAFCPSASVCEVQGHQYPHVRTPAQMVLQKCHLHPDNMISCHRRPHSHSRYRFLLAVDSPSLAHCAYPAKSQHRSCGLQWRSCPRHGKEHVYRLEHVHDKEQGGKRGRRLPPSTTTARRQRRNTGPRPARRQGGEETKRRTSHDDIPKCSCFKSGFHKQGLPGHPPTTLVEMLW